MPEFIENAQGILMRKVGPLPVVAWGGIGVIAFVAWRAVSGGPSSDPATRTIVDAFDPSLAGDGGSGGTGTGTGGGSDAGAGAGSGDGGSTVTPPLPFPRGGLLGPPTPLPVIGSPRPTPTTGSVGVRGTPTVAGIVGSVSSRTAPTVSGIITGAAPQQTLPGITVYPIGSWSAPSAGSSEPIPSTTIPIRVSTGGIRR